MKRTLCLLVFLLMATYPLAADITLDYSNVTGVNIVFTGLGSNVGATFTMTTTTKDTGGGHFNAVGFQITDGHGLPSVAGLYGNVEGTYEYENKDIATSGSLQEATPVTLFSGSVPNIFHIWDGAGVALTADVDWISISTHATAGSINDNGVVNLSNLHYLGSNASLQQLAHSLPSMTATFQFNPAQSLKHMETKDAVHATSFSGTITSVPEPTFYSSFVTDLAGLSLLPAVFLLRFRRRR